MANKGEDAQSSVRKDRVQLLVDALRSGKYKQTKGQLKGPSTEDSLAIGYCCLGVACAVYSKAAKKGVDWKEGVLPENVRAWFGLPYSNPSLGVSEEDVWDYRRDVEYRNPYDRIVQAGDDIQASTANDHANWDFLRIADAFQREYIDAVPSPDNG